jgi:hypothetical protein
LHKGKTRAKVIRKRLALVFLKVLKNGAAKKEYIPKMKSVKKMKSKWLIPTILVVFLVAFVTKTQIHTAKAAVTRNITQYGSYSQGWGFTASNITSPGPRIVVEQGDTVNLTLINNDGGIYAAAHRFFVSYTNTSSPGTGDPQSTDIPGSGTVNYQFTATNTIGTYTYYCVYHPTVMWGYFQVVATGTIPEFQPLMLLSVFVASVAVAALVYRRKRRI